MAHFIDPNKCTACGDCIDSCPVEAISEGKFYVINADDCTDCGACVGECTHDAIEAQ